MIYPVIYSKKMFMQWNPPSFPQVFFISGTRIHPAGSLLAKHPSDVYIIQRVYEQKMHPQQQKASRLFMRQDSAKKIELLAPAGNLTVALAALDAGADAVYCGLKKFNARERSDNFSPEEMSKLIACAHGIGSKVYITFNTLIRESEIDDAADQLALLAQLRPDAVIVQDIGVVRMIREYFPELTIHGSTQMALHDSMAVRTAEQMGIRRVILERQITLEELEIITKKSSLELEIFVHGALCVCLSGTCLFSSWLGGASGNRGRCKQPCRRLFRSDRGKEAFYLSSKDLAAMELIPKFRELGIASLKIEGRLRRADYVANVVAAYRKALDTNDPESALPLLNETCSRERSLGFYTQDSTEHLIRPDVPGGIGRFCGRVKRVLHDAFEVELSGRIHLGDNVRVQSASGGEGQALSILDLRIGGRAVKKAFPGQVCRIPSRGKTIAPDGILYKIGETHDTMEKRCRNLPLQKPLLDLNLHLDANALTVRPLLPGIPAWESPLTLSPAEKRAVTPDELIAAFRIPNDSPFAPGSLRAEIDGALFLPQTILKTLRREFWKWTGTAIQPEQLRRLAEEKARALKEHHRRLAKQMFPAMPPVVFLSAGAPNPLPGAIIARELSFGILPEEECILPFFTPETEIEELQLQLENLIRKGIRVFRIASLSHIALLGKYKGIVLKTAPPLPVANAFAVEELRSLGVSTFHGQIELARTDLEELRQKAVLPMEQYVFGNPVLLATRAGLPKVKYLSEPHGETFLVERHSGLATLHPKHPMRVELLPDMIPIHDLRTPSVPEESPEEFNFSRGLA